MEFHDMAISSSSSSSSSSSEVDIRSPAVNNSRGGRNLSLAPTPSPKRKAGRKKFRETRHPVYHGVRERKGGKWVCEVREPHKKNRIWLGTYTTPEMAARAHDVAAIALRGNSAVLNFPHLAWDLPRASSMSPDDIRAAASKAAKMCSVDDQTHLFSNKHKCDSSIANLSAGETELIEDKEVLELRLPEMVVDEDEVFNMPLVVEEMARGLLLTPPVSLWSDCWDGMDSYMDLSLWNMD